LATAAGLAKTAATRCPRMRGLRRFGRPTRFAAMGLLAGCVGLLTFGCGKSEDHGNGESSGLTKVKVSYIALTCEPPIYVAFEKGFFKDEGLDVELVKSDWDSMRDGLGLGKFDATHHLIMYLLKPIEQGLNVRLTGGIHSGCLRVQAGIKSDINKVADLKGKKVGISHMGAPPFLFGSRVMAAQGLDPKKDVEWITYPSDAMELALDQGQVDAVCDAEPIGTILLGRQKVRKVVDQALDVPYSDEFCCVTAVNGTFAEKNPQAAAGVTRALLRGAKWVAANKTAAAKLAVEKGYLAATPELNVQAISQIKYIPAVAKARRDILQVAKEMSKAEFLSPSTDPEELTKRAWLDLPGVTDEWLQSIEVEKIAGGGDPPKLTPVELAQLIERQKSCCRYGCCGDLDKVMLLTGEWARITPRFWDPGQIQKGETQLVNSSR
jgi:NitT/TauT family transport system substrate-binding protein